MTQGIIISLLVLCLIWLGIVTFYLRRLMEHYQVLTRGVNKKNLEFVLENLTKETHLVKKNISNLISRCDTIEKNETYYIQKIGLLRFNPFKDTGGDQSFILTLSDANNTGVVITGLYSRSGLRWYAKSIFEGKGIEHELSEEEKKALKIAKNIKETTVQTHS
ncbi:DUF4446 family protein [Patescibacteria group bacterium]|nr:DUF4446 family protein [Patescibacteria group bacterium]MBU4016513.1 DUF4446 family protein [Patescibacteria group bacterium]MBU4099132.1 DUF4446 family protein [Patescibacteria group bacterium]